MEALLFHNKHNTEGVSWSPTFKPTSGRIVCPYWEAVTCSVSQEIALMKEIWRVYKWSPLVLILDQINPILIFAPVSPASVVIYPPSSWDISPRFLVLPQPDTILRDGSTVSVCPVNMTSPNIRMFIRVVRNSKLSWSLHGVLASLLITGSVRFLTYLMKSPPADLKRGSFCASGRVSSVTLSHSNLQSQFTSRLTIYHWLVGL
jgi:hypothetical protein